MSNETAPPLLNDDEARRKAARELEQSWFVEAAAGTGKTTVMVERAVNIVCAGRARIEQIVAITFTENAAAELKARLRERLVFLRQSAQGEARERCRCALAELDYAPIGTIHSFCASLLRERPLEAGVDPAFDIAEPNVAVPLLRKEAWRDWLGRQLGGAADALRAGFLAGVSLAAYHTLAEKMLGDRPALAAGKVDADFSTDSHCAELFRRTDELAGFIDEHCANHKDTLYRRARDLLEAIDRAREASGEKQVQALADCADSSTAKGAVKNWTTPTERDSALERLNELAAMLRTVQHPVAAASLQWLKGYLESYRQLKRRRGLLDFDDLLLETRQLLRDNQAVRRELQQRFRCILIDEFQDTDPLQTEILWLLAASDARTDDWRKAQPEPGKLFVVGDPKQSIFRFRRADIEVFEEARQSFSSNENLHLTTNFRSSPAVIDFVNAMFGQLIKPPADGCYQPEYVALDAYRPDRAAGRVIYLMPSPDEDALAERPKIKELREYEAELIARWLKRTLETGGLDVVDRTTGEVRPVEPRDAAILFRRLSNLALYESALRRAGLEHHVLGGKTFYGASEVQALIHLMRATDSPRNQLDFVAVLRSGVFACSDEQLFLCSERHGLNYAELAQLAPEEVDARLAPILSAARQLAQWKAESNRLPVSALVEKMIADARLEILFGTRSDGARRLANLRKTIDIVRELERGEVFTLRAASEYLAEQQRIEVDEAESPVVEESENAVRLLTIHKAKGLEYPVVILADMMSGGGPRESVNLLLERESGRLEVRLRKSVETAGFTQLAAREELREQAEEIRLLYVACTRARDHLVLPLVCDKGPLPGMFKEAGMTPRPEDSKAAKIKLGPDKVIEATVVWSADLAQLPPESAHFRKALLKQEPGPPAAQVQQALAERKEWLERQAQLAAPEAAGRKIILPSALAHAGDEDERSSKEIGAKRPEASGEFGEGRRVDSDGRLVGAAVHRVLEQVELPAGENAERLIAAIAEELTLSEEERTRAARLVRATLAAPDFQRIAQATEVHREVPICVQVDGALLEGFIDCLFRDEAGWWVVDYKTDRIPSGGCDELIARYRPQGMAYVQALRQALGGPATGQDRTPSDRRVAGCLLFLLAADPPVLMTIVNSEL